MQLKYSNYVAFSHDYGFAVNNSGLLSKIYPFAHYIVSGERMQEKTPVSLGPFPDLADVFLSHCPGIPGHQKMHLIGIEPLIYNPQPPINAVFLDHWC